VGHRKGEEREASRSSLYCRFHWGTSQRDTINHKSVMLLVHGTDASRDPLVQSRSLAEVIMEADPEVISLGTPTSSKRPRTASG
jgi:hypothetical protein